MNGCEFGAHHPESRQGSSAVSRLVESTTIALTYLSLAHNIIALKTDLPA